MGFNKAQYDSEFIKKNYDRFLVTVPKGKKALLKAQAENRGIPLNTLIVDALEAYCGVNLSKD